MAKVTIKTDSFTGKDGKAVTYERLVVRSERDSDLALELRLDTTQMSLFKAILKTDGQSTGK